MASISFVSAGTLVTGANPTVTVPARVGGDMLIIVVSGGTSTPTTPTGWTSTYAQGANTFTTVFYKIANGLESTVALTVAGTATKAVVLVYRGVGIRDVTSTVATGASTSATTGTLAAGYDGEYILSIYMSAASVQTLTAPGSTTSRVNSGGTASLSNLLIVDELLASAGTSTARTATFSTSTTWYAIAISFAPIRDLYWAGTSTDTWTTTNTSWAITSGGTIGTTKPPTQGDNVIFDGFSDGYCTVVGTVTCRDFIIRDPVPSTFVLDGTTVIQIYGNLDLTNYTGTSSSNFGFIGTYSFLSPRTCIVGIGGPSSPAQYITLGGALTFNNTLGSWIVGTTSAYLGYQSSLTIDTTVAGITLTAGNLIIGDNATLIGSSFTSTGSTARAITIPDAGTLTVNALVTATSWNVTSTGLSLNIAQYGSIRITTSASSSITTTIAGGGATYYGIFIVDNQSFAWTCTLTGSNTFQNLQINSTVAYSILNFYFTAATTTTVSAISVSADPVGYPGSGVYLRRTGTTGTWNLAKRIWSGWQRDFCYGASSAVVIISNCAVTSGTFYTGAATDAGNNTGLSFSSAPQTTTYWIGGSGTWDSGNSFHWSSSTGGTGGYTAPGNLDSVVFDSGSSAVNFQVDTSSVGLLLKGLTISPTHVLTLNIPSPSTIFIYANLSLPSGNLITSGNGAVKIYESLYSNLPLRISTNNIPISWSLTIGIGQDVEIFGNLTVNNNLVLDHNGQVFRSNIYTYGSSITCNVAQLGNMDTVYSYGQAPKQLNLGGGTLTITNVDGSDPTNLIPITFNSYIDVSNGQVVLSNSSSSITRTVQGSSNVNISNLIIGGTGTGTTTKFSSFNTIYGNISSTKTTSHTMTFGSNTTTSVGTWNVSGSAGQLVTVNSSSPGWQFNLHKV